MNVLLWKQSLHHQEAVIIPSKHLKVVKYIAIFSSKVIPVVYNAVFCFIFYSKVCELRMQRFYFTLHKTIFFGPNGSESQRIQIFQNKTQKSFRYLQNTILEIIMFIPWLASCRPFNDVHDLYIGILTIFKMLWTYYRITVRNNSVQHFNMIRGQ